METLKENWQFRKLYRKTPKSSSVLVTYYSKNRLGINRVGITASKKIGKAHERNRARRVIREAYRMLESNIGSGYDFVFVARTKTTLVKTERVFCAMSEHLSEIMKK